MPSSAKGVAPTPGTTKTVGIQLDAETYSKLLAFMEREGIKVVKTGALEAVKAGLAEVPPTKAQATHLWKLLDDIDTLMDSCGDDDAAYRARANELCRKRHEDAISQDGHTLVWAEPT